MSTPEAALERRFAAAVLRRGGMVVKLAPTVRGLPDRLVLLPGGRIELVELKAPGGRLSLSQRIWHDKAAQRGVIVTVLTGAPEIDAWADRV